MTAGQVHHLTARVTSTSDREMILDGDFANEGNTTSTTTVDVTKIDRISAGKRDNDYQDNPFNGVIYELSAWDVALTDDEITLLNAGAPPMLIRPASLVHWWPHWQAGTVIDVVGGTHLTVTSATTVVGEAPRIPWTQLRHGKTSITTSERMLKARVSNLDVWLETSGLVVPGRPFSWLASIDTDASELTLTLDDGQTSTVAISGPNAQTGDLIVAAGLNAGSVVDESTDALGLSDLSMFEDAVSGVEAERAFDRMARELAPAVTNTSLNSEGNTVNVVDLTSFVSDKGQGWSVTAVTIDDSAKASVEVVSNSSVSITTNSGSSAIGSTIVRCTITNQNPRPKSSELQIALAVTQVEAGAFSNGYNNEKSIVLSPQASSGLAETDFIFRLHITDTDLRDTGNGGDVTSATGADIRFELEDETQLSHSLIKYVNTTGEMEVAIRIPSWRTNEALPIRMFYGLSGADDQNANDVYRSEILAVELLGGTDLAGRGRDFTANGISSGTLIGEAGDYDGTNSYLSLADSDWLDGLTAFSFRGWINADTATLGTDKALIASGNALFIRYDGSGFFGGAANTIAAQVSSGGVQVRSEGAAEVQSDEEQHIAVTWQVGQAPRIFVDGVENERTFTGDAASAPLQTDEDTVYIGARNATDGRWGGVLDEFFMSAEALSPDRIAAEYGNQRDPGGTYGISAANTPGATRLPVAVPLRQTAVEDGETVFDVLTPAQDAFNAMNGGSNTSETETGDAHDYGSITAANVDDSPRYVPLAIDGNPRLPSQDVRIGDDDDDTEIPVQTLTVSAVGSASDGTVTNNGDGTITYEPDAAFVGQDTFTVTITDGTNTSTATMTVDVVGLSAPITGTVRPLGDSSKYMSGLYSGWWGYFRNAPIKVGGDGSNTTERRWNRDEHIMRIIAPIDGTIVRIWLPTRAGNRNDSSDRCDGGYDSNGYCRSDGEYSVGDGGDSRIQVYRQGNDNFEEMNLGPLVVTGDLKTNVVDSFFQSGQYAPWEFSSALTVSDGEVLNFRLYAPTRQKEYFSINHITAQDMPRFGDTNRAGPYFKNVESVWMRRGTSGPYVPVLSDYSSSVEPIIPSYMLEYSGKPYKYYGMPIKYSQDRHVTLNNGQTALIDIKPEHVKAIDSLHIMAMKTGSGHNRMDYNISINGATVRAASIPASSFSTRDSSQQWRTATAEFASFSYNLGDTIQVALTVIGGSYRFERDDPGKWVRNLQVTNDSSQYRDWPGRIVTRTRFNNQNVADYVQVMLGHDWS